MARSGLKAFVRVVNQLGRAVERENKRRAREAAQRQREQDREFQRLERDMERERVARARQQERDRAQQERQNKLLAKESVQAFISAGQDALTLRCKERAVARESILRSIFV